MAGKARSVGSKRQWVCIFSRGKGLAAGEHTAVMMKKRRKTVEDLPGHTTGLCPTHRVAYLVMGSG